MLELIDYKRIKLFLKKQGMKMRERVLMVKETGDLCLLTNRVTFSSEDSILNDLSFSFIYSGDDLCLVEWDDNEYEDLGYL